MGVNALTVAELRARQAELSLRAERKREEWTTAPAVGPRALFLGRQVRVLQTRADDYAALLRVAEGMS
jgi:hypothetical protein